MRLDSIDRFSVPYRRIVPIAAIIIMALMMGVNRFVSMTATIFHNVCQATVARTLPVLLYMNVRITAPKNSETKNPNTMKRPKSHL